MIFAACVVGFLVCLVLLVIGLFEPSSNTNPRFRVIDTPPSFDRHKKALTIQYRAILGWVDLPEMFTGREVTVNTEEEAKDFVAKVRETGIGDYLLYCAISNTSVKERPKEI